MSWRGNSAGGRVLTPLGSKRLLNVITRCCDFVGPGQANYIKKFRRPLFLSSPLLSSILNRLSSLLSLPLLLFLLTFFTFCSYLFTFLRSPSNPSTHPPLLPLLSEMDFFFTLISAALSVSDDDSQHSSSPLDLNNDPNCNGTAPYLCVVA